MLVTVFNTSPFSFNTVICPFSPNILSNDSLFIVVLLNTVFADDSLSADTYLPSSSLISIEFSVFAKLTAILVLLSNCLSIPAYNFPLNILFSILLAFTIINFSFSSLSITILLVTFNSF